MVCVRMKVIKVKGCRDCPHLTAFGCGYDCYYCGARKELLASMGVTLKRVDRKRVEESGDYSPGWCPLDED